MGLGFQVFDFFFPGLFWLRFKVKEPKLYNTQIQKGNSELNIDQNTKQTDGLLFRHF